MKIRREPSSTTDLLFGIYSIGLTSFVVAALYFGRELLIPVALAFLLTFLLSPAVARFERQIGHAGAVLLVVVMVFALLSAAGWFLTRQMIDLATKLPDYSSNITAKLHSVHFPRSPVIDRLSQMMDELEKELPPGIVAPAASTADAQSANQAFVGARGTPAAVPVAVVPPGTRVQWISRVMLHAAGVGGLVMILLIFMLAQGNDLRVRLIRLMGQGHISETTRAMEDAGRRVLRYLTMQLLVNTGFGLAAAAGLFVIGVPNPGLWGTCAGVLRFIPYVGAWIAAAFPAILSCAVAPDWTMPLLTLGWFAVLELSVANLIEPLLYGSSTGVSSLALVLAAVFWFWLWGPIGLVLATPLTVCLVVVGRYVPQLEIFSILLGDAEPLTPAEACYHRLLSQGLTEAGQIVDAYTEANSLTALYDQVLLPAVTKAELDCRRQALSEPQRLAVLQSIRDLIQELESRPPAQPGVEGDDAPSDDPGCRVLCVPARAARDEVAGLMLAHLLRQRGISVQNAVVDNRLPELGELVTTMQASVVCISVLPPSNVIHARYLCRRLRDQFPSLRIVIGMWSASEGLDDVALGLRERGADAVVGSLAEAVARIANPIASSPDSSFPGVTGEAAADDPDNPGRARGKKSPSYAKLPPAHHANPIKVRAGER